MADAPLAVRQSMIDELYGAHFAHAEYQPFEDVINAFLILCRVRPGCIYDHFPGDDFDAAVVRLGGGRVLALLNGRGLCSGFTTRRCPARARLLRA